MTRLLHAFRVWRIARDLARAISIRKQIRNRGMVQPHVRAGRK